MLKSAAAIVLLFLVQAATQPPTMREVLASAGIADLGRYPESLLNTRLSNELLNGRYFHVGYPITPSAEGLFVLSSDRKVLVELNGWELLTLPNGSIVYHNSMIHFAPTHSLSISVFNPETGRVRQIYPPKPDQAARRSFIDRVAKVYKERGEEWFRENNHHMNPEFFDTALISEVTLDPVSKSMSFLAQFGDSNNARDPLPFTQRIVVRCAPIDITEQLRCTESAQ